MTGPGLRTCALHFRPGPGGLPMALRLSEVLCISQHLRARCSFPTSHDEQTSGRPVVLRPRPPRRPPRPSPNETNAPLRGRPNELDWLPAERPARHRATLSDRRATPPPSRQDAASAAGPTNMIVLKPRPDAPPVREQFSGPSVPYSTRAAALPHQLSMNPHSWLLWISMSGGDRGLLF